MKKKPKTSYIPTKTRNELKENNGKAKEEIEKNNIKCKGIRKTNEEKLCFLLFLKKKPLKTI